ncbi:Acg family FMN-binding oxidoreductase [Nocardia rhizosphaerae]|uniref:Acg family FMN-binding oxidoreductase n=1 Tax=Nocardia rhizosphaerae TaxID=1691571 RepID=A0ABV8LA80_9NOCA
MDTGPTGEVIEKAVRLAGRAPSLHNTQPWQWTFDGHTMYLFAEPRRMLPSTDTTGRQMVLSCGIALGHLRVALAAEGWRCDTDYAPDPNRRTHLATITFHRAELVTDADRVRADAISRRHTDRHPFAAPPDRTDLATVLCSAVDPGDATIDVLADTDRPGLAEATRLTAAQRRYDAGYQAELRWWTGHTFPTAGVPAAALPSRAENAGVGIDRDFPGSPETPDSPQDDHALVLVLGTSEDTPAQLLRCGVAISTVLLECTLLGFATCPLTHLTEVPRSRTLVREMTGRDVRPQMLIRVGLSPFAADRAATPRLPLTDILDLTTSPTGNGHERTNHDHRA